MTQADRSKPTNNSQMVFSLFGERGDYVKKKSLTGSREIFETESTTGEKGKHQSSLFYLLFIMCQLTIIKSKVNMCMPDLISALEEPRISII